MYHINWQWKWKFWMNIHKCAFYDRSGSTCQWCRSTLLTVHYYVGLTVMFAILPSLYHETKLQHYNIQSQFQLNCTNIKKNLGSTFRNKHNPPSRQNHTCMLVETSCSSSWWILFIFTYTLVHFGQYMLINKWYPDHCHQLTFKHHLPLYVKTHFLVSNK